MAPLRIDGFPRGAAITIIVNGRPLRAYEGETVHAALLAGGLLTLRRSRTLDEPRGIFCGMGVCQECLVTVDGVPHQRACMLPVAAGMEIVIDDPR